jgi:hypothetical protein
MFRGAPFPQISFGDQMLGGAGGTGSMVGGPDENLRRLMEMLKRFNPKLLRGFGGVVDVPASGLPGTEGV